MVGDFRVRNLLRALLHGSGWTAAIADQRAAVFADRANQSCSSAHSAAQFSGSVQWPTSSGGHVCHAFDQPDAVPEPAPALRPGLGPEHTEVLGERSFT